MRVAVGLFTGVLAVAVAGCGGSSGGGGQTCNPGPSFTLTIGSGGAVTPTNACVTPGGTVTFQNNDTASHHVEFDQSGCPAAADVSPGQSGAITFPTAVQCTYHVSGSGGGAATATGTVIATTAQQSGGGY